QAIGNSRLGIFQQDAGGWGGSFYFWDAPLHFRLPDQTTVGRAIQDGGIPESPKASLEEFFYANANATADFWISTARTATSGTRFPSSGGTLSLLLKDLPVSGLRKAITDTLEAIASGFQAQAPAKVKIELIGN